MFSIAKTTKRTIDKETKIDLCNIEQAIVQGEQIRL